MKPAVFHPDARAEFDEATRRYSERSTVASDEFVDAIEGALQKIQLLPATFPRWPRRENIHKFVLRRFPFIVVYAVEPEMLSVVAVAHTSKRPGYWVRRLPRRRR